MKKVLKVEDIATPLGFEVKHHDLAMSSVAKLCDPERYKFDFEVFLKTKGMYLQRPLVWTLQQKQELILSLIKGIRIPPISIIEFNDDTDRENKITHYEVIDGKQRLTTLFSFYKNEFPITFEGEDYYYNDLEPEFQRFISLYYPRFQVAYEYMDQLISDDEKIKWFKLINFAGTPQDKLHLDNLLKNN